MSMLGKILAILNVLAAVGFFYLATMVWAKRLAWENAALQHEMVISGLPADEEEKDLEGNPRVQDLSKSLLDRMFQPVGGSAVKTQKDEIERVKNRLLAWVDDDNFTDPRFTDPQTKAPLKPNKAQKYATILVPLADRGQDRLDLYKRAADPTEAKQDETDRLRKRFDDTFSAILSHPVEVKKGPDGAWTGATPGTGGQDTARDGSEQRRSFAALLCRLCEVLEEADVRDAKDLGATAAITEWKSYKRYLTVVGLLAAQKALDEYRLALERATEEMQIAVDGEREQYLSSLARKVQNLEDYARQLEENTKVLTIERERATQFQEQVNKQKETYKKVSDQMEEARRETKEKLERQAVMEENLFKSRQRMRDAFGENQRLEQKIRELERGR